MTPALPSAQHFPTLEEAYGIKTLKRLAATSDGEFLAYELSGKIEIFSNRARSVVCSFPGRAPAWSPDSKSLAYFSADENKELQLYVWAREKQAAERITAFAGGVRVRQGSAIWSPGSCDIAFIGYPEVNVADFGAAADIPRVRVVNRASPPDAIDDGWEGESNTKAAVAERYRAMHPAFKKSQPFVVNIATKTVRALRLASPSLDATWSPDGRSLLVVSDRTDYAHESRGWPMQTRPELVDILSGASEQIDCPFTVVQQPIWNPTSDTVVFKAGDSFFGYYLATVYNVATKKWKTLAPFQDRSLLRVKWSGDGKRLSAMLADRFVDTLWSVEPETNQWTRVDTKELSISDQLDSDYAVSAANDIYFVAQTPRLATSVYRIAARGGRMERIFDPNPQVANYSLCEQQRVTWINSQGDEVDGIVMFPPGFTKGESYPTLVGPTSRTRDRFHLVLNSGEVTSQYPSQLYAAKGFVVFCPSIRSPITITSFTQSRAYTEKANGAQGVDIMVDDFTSGIKYLVAQGISDPERIGLLGHSNNGYKTNLLITETKIARCAVISSGASNTTLYTAGPGENDPFGANVFERFTETVKMSSYFRFNRVKIPVMLMFGDKDYGWREDMLREYKVLSRWGCDVTMVRYSQEGHFWIDRWTVEDSFVRILDFFDQHLAKIGK